MLRVLVVVLLVLALVPAAVESADLRPATMGAPCEPGLCEEGHDSRQGTPDPPPHRGCRPTC